jgi:hypothetical protein
MKADQLAKQERHTAEAYGFTPGYDASDPNNYLYDRGRKKVYLIDFEFWNFQGRIIVPEGIAHL